jgi:hypothetical protein
MALENETYFPKPAAALAALFAVELCFTVRRTHCSRLCRRFAIESSGARSAILTRCPQIEPQAAGNERLPALRGQAKSRLLDRQKDVIRAIEDRLFIDISIERPDRRSEVVS